MNDNNLEIELSGKVYSAIEISDDVDLYDDMWWHQKKGVKSICIIKFL